MRHNHVGPLDRACPGCLDEARELEGEDRRERFWRVMLILLLMLLAIGSMGALSWYLNTQGPHLQ